MTLGTNWMGQPWHEVDNYCWFKTTPKERDELRELFESAAGDDCPENEQRREDLIKLIEKARSIAIEEAEFHSQGD